MTSRSIDNYRAHSEDAPLELLRECANWKPVVRLIDGWANEKLGANSGYSSEELDHWSQVHGVRFPPPLREWWRLAGRHPFVKPGVDDRQNLWLLAPDDRDLVDRPDFLVISVESVQTWGVNGLHFDFLNEANPQVHGLNGTIDPDDVPGLDWYKGRFIGTGLRVPALIFARLLYHLFHPSPLVRDIVVYLKAERLGCLRGEPERRLISTLGLRCFPNKALVGDIYSDGEDIIYWWLMGCACRTAEAAERVQRVMPTGLHR